MSTKALVGSSPFPQASRWGPFLCVMRLKPVRAATKCRAKHESAVGEAETPYCCLGDDGHLPPLSGRLRESHPVSWVDVNVVDYFAVGMAAIDGRGFPSLSEFIENDVAGDDWPHSGLCRAKNENPRTISRRSFNWLPSPVHGLCRLCRGEGTGVRRYGATGGRRTREKGNSRGENGNEMTARHHAATSCGKLRRANCP
jgi:hypothetical protein